MDTITVVAGRDDGRVALWERHPAQPDGEVFIAAGGAPVVCALTPAVAAALADGRLVAVKAEAQVKAAVEAEAAIAEKPRTRRGK